ncbi:hypothetical protein ACVWZK_003840 [Bradyrhizobium sp. GM0.4]
MDNRINEIRRIIRALRVSMREAEAIMHEQINRDEDCSFVAGEVMRDAHGNERARSGAGRARRHRPDRRRQPVRSPPSADAIARRG